MSPKFEFLRRGKAIIVSGRYATRQGMYEVVTWACRVVIPSLGASRPEPVAGAGGAAAAGRRGTSPSIWRERINRHKIMSHHHRINHLLPSIYVDIERPDDGNVIIAGRILGNQQAKIRWGLLTP